MCKACCMPVELLCWQACCRSIIYGVGTATCGTHPAVWWGLHQDGGHTAWGCASSVRAMHQAGQMLQGARTCRYLIWEPAWLAHCTRSEELRHISHTRVSHAGLSCMCPSKNYWQFSSTILIQFSCNNRWDFQKCPCNSHLQFSSNSHLQFSSNSHLQFSSNSHLTILIQFSPDNSHPIFTWQFSSNSHLQFSLNSHQHCSVNSHQQCSANFLVMISQSVLVSHAAIFVQCWFYNGSQ